MKYVIVIGDGMADYKIDSLGGKTPLMVAKKPHMDYMAKHGVIGYANNVPPDMVPESDTANLAVMGYDPKVSSKGRSPLEALSMGIDMKPDETAFRINTVALSEDDCDYAHQRIIDHGADEITTEESTKLIQTLEKELGDETRKYYPGVSYRHCLIWKNAPDIFPFTRPHDILGKEIGEYLPSGEIGKPYLEIMEKSYEILKNHPVNLERKKRGLLPANSLWIWGPGKKPILPSFEEKFGIKATVISAVDLIKGIGICAGMEVVDVEGATGNINTNFDGKAKAAIDALRNGSDLVYVHVEAPDECGHRAELDNKIKSIELIDDKVIGYIENELKKDGEDYKFFILPDHPTPIALRTHTLDAVPYIMYTSNSETDSGVEVYDEEFGTKDASKLKLRSYAQGFKMIDDFLK